MGMLKLLVFTGVLLALAMPLGLYMAAIYEGRASKLRFLSGFEGLLYRLCGVDAASEMDWKRYAVAALLFNATGFFVLYALQRLQAYLPLNPQGFGNKIGKLARMERLLNKARLKAWGHVYGDAPRIVGTRKYHLERWLFGDESAREVRAANLVRENQIRQ